MRDWVDWPANPPSTRSDTVVYDENTRQSLWLKQQLDKRLTASLDGPLIHVALVGYLACTNTRRCCHHRESFDTL